MIPVSLGLMEIQTKKKILFAFYTATPLRYTMRPFSNTQNQIHERKETNEIQTGRAGAAA